MYYIFVSFKFVVGFTLAGICLFIIYASIQNGIRNYLYNKNTKIRYNDLIHRNLFCRQFLHIILDIFSITGNSLQ